MRKLKNITIFIFVLSFICYTTLKAFTYNQQVENYNLQVQLENLQKDNDELQIQLTTNLSRTELMEKYPQLKLNDNIYYLEEE